MPSARVLLAGGLELGLLRAGRSPSSSRPTQDVELHRGRPAAAAPRPGTCGSWRPPRGRGASSSAGCRSPPGPRGRMIVSPFSKGISRPSILKTGISVHPRAQRSAKEVGRPHDSSIALAADHVDRAERGDDVGDHRARSSARGLERSAKHGGPHAHAVRRAAAVARRGRSRARRCRLGVRVHLAGGHLDALHHDLEVLDGPSIVV
jgi:hypothetical protein